MIEVNGQLYGMGLGFAIGGLLTGKQELLFTRVVLLSINLVITLIITMLRGNDEI